MRNERNPQYNPREEVVIFDKRAILVKVKGSWGMSHQVSGQKILQTEETVKSTGQSHGDQKKEEKERRNIDIASLIVLFNISLASSSKGTDGSLCMVFPFPLPLMPLMLSQNTVVYRQSSRTSQPISLSPSIHNFTIDFSISGDWFLSKLLWLHYSLANILDSSGRISIYLPTLTALSPSS